MIMAKDLVSALGAGELNALMAVQLKKMNEVNASLNKLFRENHCMDFNEAFGATLSDHVIMQRNRYLDEMNEILDVMQKLRQAQQNLSKQSKREVRHEQE